MGKRSRRFARAMPVWLMVGGLVMAASGAGVGTILAGGIAGEMPVAVSQSLLVGVPSFPATDADWTDGAGSVRGVTRDTFAAHHSKPDRSIGVRSDDKTAFQAAVEIDQGDKYLVQICFKNASDQNLVAQLDLDILPGLGVEVFGSDEESSSATDRVRNVVRVGPASWKFIVDADAEFDSTGWRDCIGIQVKSSDTNPPGFYSMKSKVKQVAF